MSDILQKIDTAIGCQHCGNSLNDSPSDHFCSEPCALGWHARHGKPLPGYLTGLWIDLDTTGIQVAFQRLGQVVKRLGEQLGQTWVSPTWKPRSAGPAPLCIDGHAYRRRTRRRRK